MTVRGRTLKSAVAGDVDDYRLIELDGVTNITGCTIEAHVWRDGETAANLSGSVENAGDTDTDPDDKPIIRVELGSWLESVATPGAWYWIEYEVTFVDSRVWTWPNGDGPHPTPPDRIHVRRQGA